MSDRVLSVALVPLLAALLLAVAPAPALEAQTADRVLGHEAYETWRTIGSRGLSPDGRHVHYILNLENADDTLVVAGADGSGEVRIPRGAGPTFARGGELVLLTLRPGADAVEEARGDRSLDTPRDSLGILEVATGELRTVPFLRTRSAPSDRDDLLALHLHPEADTVAGEDPEEGKEIGTLVVMDLGSGEELRYPWVDSFTWAASGEALLVHFDAPDSEGSPGTRGIYLVEPVAGAEPRPVLEGEGDSRGLTLFDDASRAAFLLGTEAQEGDEADAGDAGEETVWTLHLWEDTEDAARPLADSRGLGVEDGWGLSPWSPVNFSDSGDRVFFGTAPHQDPVPQDRNPLDEEVEVDVWHWQDGDLMTVQRIQENQAARRNFTAVHHLADGRTVQLADPEMESVSLVDGGDADMAVGTSTTPYRMLVSWDFPRYRDTYRVDLRTGDRELLVEGTQGAPSLSPEGGFLTWYEPADTAWYAREMETGTVRNLSDDVPAILWNELHDLAYPPGSYGSAGWLRDDAAILLYDAFDVWAVDPRGDAAPRNLTAGAGRSDSVRYRLIQLDPDADAWDPSGIAMASAFHPGTKDAGFARVSLDGAAPPQLLLMEPRRFSGLTPAAEADIVLFSQETFREFPDLWTADEAFTNRSRVSDANPQQAEYRWGTSELREWTSLDGHQLQGVLIKPDDFDPTRQYPLITYFYERWSDRLHEHYAPVPHRSMINFPMYASRGYVIFIPDIPYREGYPGESAYNAIMPGVMGLVEEGFIDRDRMGLQGHSWAGYQIAFMVTRTERLFRAAAPGAPVANMTSAYGQIRWQTGLVRQFQYERTQSRLGGSLWESPMRYIENSPLFWADKIETPLLIMHNDGDGHVPWEQGIELFTALRRLGKPAWLINYNDEPHWPTSFANRRDWNIRLQQFFDHFLLDEDPPVWLVDGIPAVERGRTLGYELVEGAVIVEPDRR